MSSVCKYQQGFVDIQKLIKLSDEENDAFAASKYDGLLSEVPVVQNLFNDTMAFVGETALAGSEYYFTEISKKAEKELKNLIGISSYNVGNVLAGLAAASAFGSFSKLAFSGVLIETLRENLRKRVYIYRELSYLFRSISRDLTRYRIITSEGSLIRVRRSKIHVDNALTSTIRLRNRLREFRIFTTALHRAAFDSIEAAEAALKKYGLTGDDFRNPSALYRLRQTYFDKVIANQTLFLDRLAGAISRIINWIPDLGIISKIHYPAGITNWVAQQMFSLDADFIDRSFRPIPTDMQNTGLLILNPTIKRLMKNLSVFDDEWNSIQRLSIQICNSLDLVEGNLNRISLEMADAIKQGNDFSLTYKMPKWATELSGLRKYGDVIRETGKSQEHLARSAVTLQRAIEIAENYDFDVHDQFLGSIPAALTTISRAPFSNVFLRHAIGVSSSMAHRIEGLAGQDMRLMGVLSRFHTEENPVIKAAIEGTQLFLDQMSASSGVLTAIAQEISSGDFVTAKRYLGYLAGGYEATADLIKFARDKCPDREEELANVETLNDEIRYRDV